MRKIRTYEPDFDPRSFGEEATEIYINTHNALAGWVLSKMESIVKMCQHLLTEYFSFFQAEIQEAS